MPRSGTFVPRRIIDRATDLAAPRRTRDVRVIESLATLIEARTKRPGDHAARVADRSMAVLRSMTGADPDPDLRLGFVLHDVGQILVPESILLKAGALDDDERELLRAHPKAGVEILKPIGFSDAALAVVAHHHERFDGEGYPRGLKGERIPLAARVFSVVDAYDSMTHARPYRRAMDHDCATAELRRRAGDQFDPDCVDAFIGLSRDLSLI